MLVINLKMSQVSFMSYQLSTSPVLLCAEQKNARTERSLKEKMVMVLPQGMLMENSMCSLVYLCPLQKLSQVTLELCAINLFHLKLKNKNPYLFCTAQSSVYPPKMYLS